MANKIELAKSIAVGSIHEKNLSYYRQELAAYMPKDAPITTATAEQWAKKVMYEEVSTLQHLLTSLKNRGI